MGLGVEPVAGKLPVVEIDAVVVVAGAALAMPAVVVRAPVVTTGFIVVLILFGAVHGSGADGS